MRNYAGHSESLKWYHGCGIWESYNFQFKICSLGDFAVMNEDTLNHKGTSEPFWGSIETWRNCKGNHLKEATEYPVSIASSLWQGHVLVPPWQATTRATRTSLMRWLELLNEKKADWLSLVESLKFHSNRTVRPILGHVRGVCGPCVVH